MNNQIKKKMSQQAERKAYLNIILNSKERKKLIVSGPGTGKTYTFGKILRLNPNGKNLVITFIRKLVLDMENELGDFAEVKTFHAYCKKVLHEIFGEFELVPFLTKIIEDDSKMLDLNYENFDSKFQIIDEGSEEIEFYLERGDYYKVVSFNDSVYRLYKLLLKDPSKIDNYDIILIDEFQDFNLLEVELIRELSKKGPIVIIGDDDQAVYSGKNSSPLYLRDIYKSGNYSIFELPFCSRCPRVIVDAINSFTKNIQKLGGLSGRIDRKFEPFLEGKDYENRNYSKILKARLTTVKVLPKYLSREINNIPVKDIQDSYIEGNTYPTVLIIGQRHYLSEVEKSFAKIFPNFRYSFSQDSEINPVEVYKFFIYNQDSNFSWRLLINLYYDDLEKQKILKKSVESKPLFSILDPSFVEKQRNIAEIICELRKNKNITTESNEYLKNKLGSYYQVVFDYFIQPLRQEEVNIDKSKPTILLTSFEGCKGLSAGHVFIVGANNGSIPKIKNDKIKDIEYSKFIVALTRTRKCCHIISNKWFYSPKDSGGKWIKEFKESYFLSFIPKELIEDRGILKSSDF